MRVKRAAKNPNEISLSRSRLSEKKVMKASVTYMNVCTYTRSRFKVTASRDQKTNLPQLCSNECEKPDTEAKAELKTSDLHTLLHITNDLYGVCRFDIVYELPFTTKSIISCGSLAASLFRFGFCVSLHWYQFLSFSPSSHLVHRPLLQLHNMNSVRFLYSLNVIGSDDIYFPLCSHYHSCGFCLCYCC